MVVNEKPINNLLSHHLVKQTASIPFEKYRYLSLANSHHKRTLAISSRGSTSGRGDLHQTLSSSELSAIAGSITAE